MLVKGLWKRKCITVNRGETLRFKGSGSRRQGAGIGGLPAPARPTGSGTVDRATGDRRPEP